MNNMEIPPKKKVGRPATDKSTPEVRAFWRKAYRLRKAEQGPYWRKLYRERKDRKAAQEIPDREDEVQTIGESQTK